MSNPEYLDKTGLDELVSQTKSYVGNKVSKKIDKPVNVLPGKVLQTDSHGDPIWGEAVPQADIVQAVDDWLEENIDPGEAVTLDSTLTQAQAAAQAKAVGDKIDSLKENLVVVDDDEPESDDNVIWVPETPENEVVVPTISELNEVAGTVAKDYADLTFPVKAGTLCRHDYGLYAAKQDIPTQEAWTSGHWSTKTNIADKLDSLSTALSNSPFNGIEFVIPAGTEHSSSKDQLKCNIKSGNKYRIIRSGGGLLYAFRPDGTGISGSVSDTGTASEDIAAFGIYLNNRNGTGSITIRMAMASNPMGADIYDCISEITTINNNITSLRNDLSSYKSDVAEEIGCSPFIYNTSGYSYTLSGTSATMENGVPKTNGTDARYKSGYVACLAGDVFTVNLTGGVSARAYAFIQSDGTILEKAGESKTLTNELLTAPANTAFLILQTTGGKSSFIGKTADNRIIELESETETNANAIAHAQKCEPDTVEMQYEQGGIYPNTGNPYSSSKYIRPVGYIDVSAYKSIRFSISSGYKVGVRFYKYPNTSEGSFISGESVDLTKSGVVGIKDNFKYTRFVIGRSDNADISISESSNVQFSLASELLNRVDAIAPIVDLVDPEKTDANLVKNASFKFAFFSDIHNSSTNAERIVDFAEEKNLDCIINGGDTVQNYLNDPNNNFDWYATLLSGSSVDILSAVGNHDVWDGAYWTKAASTDIYNAIVAPIISNFSDIQQPSGAAESGLCYYYKDYSSVRVIVINAMTGDNSVKFWDSTEATWFGNVLTDANTNSKHVIVCNHAPFPKAIALRDEKSNWNSYIDYRTNASYDAIVTETDALSLINTFISGGGKFIALLTGHTHIDNILTATGYDGQFMINIASAKYSYHADGIAYSNTDSQYYDCFNYCVVDTTNGILKLKRIGWNMDASLKERKTLSYDYFNHKLLHE